jgi:hypothetical protein
MRFRNIIDCLNHGLTLIYGFHRFYIHSFHFLNFLRVLRVIHLICDSDNWQLNDKHATLSGFGLYPQLPTMCFHNIIDCLNHGLTLIYGFHRFYIHSFHFLNFLRVLRVIHLICDSDNWQLNDKHATLSGFGLYPQLPTMCFHNIMRNAQAQPVPSVPFLVVKKGCRILSLISSGMPGPLSRWRWRFQQL